MNLLTINNTTYNLNNSPETIIDTNYCVLDCSDKTYIDYFFQPLVFLEAFTCPAIVLQVGKFKIQMPLDWQVVVCDEVMTSIEIIPLTSLNDRGFHAILYNPMKHMVPSVEEINIINVYAEVKWFVPKLKQNTILVVPVEDTGCPKCMLFVKDNIKVTELTIGNLFE